MRGRISENDINAIRERTNIVDIVADYVTLKKKGKLFWGACPFHKEKTPSFKIDPVSQLFHCFGCGEGGNVFTFLMKIEHFDFPEAVEMLADKIGYSIQYEENQTPEASKRKKILEVNRMATQYYQFILLKTAQGQVGRDYAKERKLGAGIIKKYGVGLAPNSWDMLFKYLTKKGFSGEILQESGLTLKGQRGSYDRFRSRLIFPITDLQGRTIAFGGRIIGQGEPKYLNSPETAVYHKSSTLYGLYLAKNSIVSEGHVLVVEGYTDVLALAQAGIKNAVATLGTAFTADHINILRRFTDYIVLVFDADTAGMKAAESVGSHMSEFRPPRMESLQQWEGREAPGLDVRVAVLPDQLDPAEFISTRDADSFKGLIKDAEPFFDFYLTREIDKYNISEVRQKERAALSGLKFIATLDPLLRGAYLGKIADKLGIEKNALELKFSSVLRGGRFKTGSIERETRATNISPQEKVEKSILKFLLKYPDKRAKIFSEVDEDYFSDPAHARLFTVLKDMGEGKFDASDLDHFDSELKTKVTELFLTGIGCEEENLSKFFTESLIYLKDFYCKRQISKLKRELQGSKAQADQEYYDSLFEELIAIEAKRRDLRHEGIVG
jgi:DNA primase